MEILEFKVTFILRRLCETGPRWCSISLSKFNRILDGPKPIFCFYFQEDPTSIICVLMLTNRPTDRATDKLTNGHENNASLAGVIECCIKFLNLCTIIII